MARSCGATPGARVVPSDLTKSFYAALERAISAARPAIGMLNVNSDIGEILKVNFDNSTQRAPDEVWFGQMTIASAKAWT